MYSRGRLYFVDVIFVRYFTSAISEDLNTGAYPCDYGLDGVQLAQVKKT